MYWWRHVKLKTVTLATTSHKPAGKQICMSGLDTAQWKFSITSEDKFKYQWILIPYLRYRKVNNQQNKAWTKNLKYILDKINQLKQTSMNTQPSHLAWPSTNIYGNKIFMYGLDMAHRRFSTTLEENFRINERWSYQCKKQVNKQRRKYGS